MRVCLLVRAREIIYRVCAGVRACMRIHLHAAPPPAVCMCTCVCLYESVCVCGHVCMRACLSASSSAPAQTHSHTSTFLAIPLQQRSAGLLTHPLLERGLLLDYRMSELHGGELARPAPVCATPRPRVRPPSGGARAYLSGVAGTHLRCRKLAGSAISGSMLQL